MEAASAEGTAVIAAAPPAAHAVDRGGRLLRHPLPVTLLAVGLATLAFTSYSAPAPGAIAAFIAAILVVIAAIDLERRIIPNRVVLPATALVLAARVAVSPSHTADYVLAAIGAGLVFLIPNLINRSAMGMGDVKLAVFLGAGLGRGVVGAIVVAFISVFPFAVGALIRGGLAARKSTLPFGPFLALGGLVVLIVPRLVG
jgi:leader peptidase (prepilin peptidase) / N-methyltransferase